MLVEAWLQLLRAEHPETANPIPNMKLTFLATFQHAMQETLECWRQLEDLNDLLCAVGVLFAVGFGGSRDAKSVKG